MKLVLIDLGLFAMLAFLPSQAETAKETRRFPKPIATPAEYPEFSRRVEQEGDVTIAFTVGKNGRVASCSVERSSGFPELDAESCRGAKRSWRFATDDDPAFYDVSIHRTIKWRLGPSGEKFAPGWTSPVALPDPTRGVNIADPGELPPGRRANLALYLKVTATGAVESCSVRWGSGNGTLDRKTCKIVSERWRYQPAMKNGAAVPELVLPTFFWAAPDAPLADVDADRPLTGSER